MDEWGGCIVAIIVVGLVIGLIYGIIVGGALALTYIGLTVVIAVEFVAHGFSAVGIVNPVLAWLILGFFLGGTVGLAVGFRKAGKHSAFPIVFIVGGLLCVALVLASAKSSNQSRTSPPVADQAEADQLTWTDPATKLMWAKRDNGSDVNWQQATDYCRSLQLAGQRDWRLPTPDELRGIYDPSVLVNGRHIKGNLQLSGGEWSSSSGDVVGEALTFKFFGNGNPTSFRLDFTNNRRALCVRGSETTSPAANSPGAAASDQNTTEQPPPQNAPEEAVGVWTDPATGLMWAKKDNGYDVTWQQAKSFCENLQLADHSDWRLASSDELRGIYDPNTDNGSHVMGNLQLSSWWQWSSTPMDASGEMWMFNFFLKRRDYLVNGSNAGRVLCVRPSGQVQRPLNAQEVAAVAWTDPATGLMWAREDNDIDVDWQQATDYCRNLQLAGHSGWRLPTIDELQVIYDDINGGHSVRDNLKLSNDNVTEYRWSSSPGNASGKAWTMNFGYGQRSTMPLDTREYTRARCVRNSGA
jgi:hypothetical protein